MYNPNSSGCYLNISEGNEFGNFYRMHELDRICGELENYEIIPEGLLAVIEGIPILLPTELEEKLSDMVNHKIAILKLSGFHFRELREA